MIDQLAADTKQLYSPRVTMDSGVSYRVYLLVCKWSHAWVYSRSPHDSDLHRQLYIAEQSNNVSLR